MPRVELGTHLSKPFNEELTFIHERLCHMARLVQHQVDLAVYALLQLDAGVAAQVLGNESAVDDLEKIIDEACAMVFAKRQPAAIDLRLLLATSKSVADLERIGDESVKLAVMVQELVGRRGAADHHPIRVLAEQVCQMLARTVPALEQLDATAAAEVAVDLRYRDALPALLGEHAARRAAIPELIDVTWALRSLERVGDHARNLCEQLIYLSTGKDVRHLSVEKIRAAIA